jgi:hypothetical protein
VSNASQGDLDGDSAGNVCDDDRDGDGISNSQEAGLGTNPDLADTDGDGTRDGADSCPLTSGSGANGCPVATAAPAPSPGARDTAAPRLKLSVAGSVKRKAFKKGLSAAVNTNESSSLEFKLVGSARRGKRGGPSPTLASQKLPIAGAGTRAVRMRPSRKLVSKASKFTVQLVVTAVDRSGNRAVATKSIRVR